MIEMAAPIEMMYIIVGVRSDILYGDDDERYDADDQAEHDADTEHLEQEQYDLAEDSHDFGNYRPGLLLLDFAGRHRTVCDC